MDRAIDSHESARLADAEARGISPAVGVMGFWRRLLPLMGAHSFGTFADNALRQAIIIVVVATAGIAYGAADFSMPYGLAIYAGSIVSTAFSLPIFLFSMIAGQVADRVSRDFLLRTLKFVELLIMMFAALCFAIGNGPLLVFALFLMGSQSAFFGPVRQSLMPAYYPGNELPKANGFFNGIMFLFLVMGLGLGGIFILFEGGRIIVSAMLIGAALVGWGCSFFCPPAPAPGLARIDWNVAAVTVHMFRLIGRLDGVMRPLLAIAWYWGVQAAALALLPAFVVETLGADEAAINVTLLLSAIGGGLGSIVAGVVASRMQNPLTLSGIAVVGKCLAGVLVWVVAQDYVLPAAGFVSVANLPLLLILIFSAFSAAIFVVPLMAAFQHRAPNKERARIMATASMAAGGAATASAILIVPPMEMGLGAEDIFLIVAGLQAILFVYMVQRYLRRDDGPSGMAPKPNA